MIIAVGPDVVRCPIFTCGASLGPAHQGRRTRKWFRHCLNPNGCKATAVSDERPLDMQPIHEAPVIGPYAGELPLAPMAAAMQTTLDYAMRAAGEREPGEDD